MTQQTQRPPIVRTRKNACEESPEALFWGSPPVQRGYSQSDSAGALYISSLAPTSQRSAIRRLNNLAAAFRPYYEYDYITFPWHTLKPVELQRMRSDLRNRLRPNSVNQILNVLRRVLQCSVDVKKLTWDGYWHLTAQLARVTPEHTLPGRELSTEELTRLYACFDPLIPGGARYAAIIAVMEGCGLRSLETCRLNLDDIDVRTNEIVILGKHLVRRRVPLTDHARTLLTHWIRFRGDKPGALFYRTLSQGKTINDTGRIVPTCIYQQLVRLRPKSGVVCTPHDLRRTYITRLHRLGVDIHTIAKLAGHKDLRTTMIYDKRGDEAMHEAIHTYEQHYGYAFTKRYASLPHPCYP